MENFNGDQYQTGRKIVDVSGPVSDRRHYPLPSIPPGAGSVGSDRTHQSFSDGREASKAPLKGGRQESRHALTPTLELKKRLVGRGGSRTSSRASDRGISGQ